jgi:transglutaminase-like putative cysteine protease
MVGSHGRDLPATAAGQDLAVLSLRIGCEFAWEADVATAAVVQVEPRNDAGYGFLRAAWRTVPEIPARTYVDGFGNLCRRLVLPAGASIVAYEAVLQTTSDVDDVDGGAREVAPADLPDDVLVFTLPSRFCQSDLLGDEAWARFGTCSPGFPRAQAISDYVHQHLTWKAGASIPSTTAVDVYQSGFGVCRDFAHLFISLCRALNIPARYVFGYLPDVGVPKPEEPMDFCAWTEAYLSDRWYTFDPRNNTPRAGRVVIGRGRDALDVAMFTTFGGPDLRSMKVWADEAEPAAL